jgi:hypothetical protein
MSLEKAKSNVHYWLEKIENDLYHLGYRNIKDISKIIEPILQQAKEEWETEAFNKGTDAYKHNTMTNENT